MNLNRDLTSKAAIYLKFILFIFILFFEIILNFVASIILCFM